MKLSKAWTVAAKDFKTFTKKPFIIYSIVVFEVITSIVLPVLINFIGQKAKNPAVLPTFINAFSWWFVIGAALMPVSIAAFSLVGEKVQKSLEPLLATPISDGEILAGKTIAAFLPAIIANYLGAIVFTVLVDVFTHSALGYYFFPNSNIVIILLLLSPLACLMSVGFNVLISSRVNDVRSAQQLGALILLPLAAVYFLTDLQVIQLTPQILLILGVIFVAVDVILFFLARATFQREQILTRWK